LKERGLLAGGIDGDGVDHGVAVDEAVLEGGEEVGALLAYGAGEFKTVALLAERGGAGGERVAGVHPGAGVGGEERAVEAGLAGFGVDLDSSSAEGRLAVFG